MTPSLEPNGAALRSLASRLAKWGAVRLLTSPVGLVCLVVLVRLDGVSVLPGALAGCVAGIGLALFRPSVFGMHVPSGPSRYSPEMRRLQREVINLRQPALMVLSSVPYFVIVGAIIARCASSLVLLDPLPYAVAGIAGGIEVWAMATGVQDIQVAWRLTRRR